MENQNIFKKIPSGINQELIETIICSDKVKIERIVSTGQASPAGFWYDQDKSEWVVVLKGRACLLFEKNSEQLILEQGDHINIPAHTKHRVEWTDKEQTTIWLAVHY